MLAVWAATGLRIRGCDSHHTLPQMEHDSGRFVTSCRCQQPLLCLTHPHALQQVEPTFSRCPTVWAEAKLGTQEASVTITQPAGGTVGIGLQHSASASA